jgi:hypothetical protein
MIRRVVVSIFLSCETREPSQASVQAIFRLEEVEWAASECTQVAISCVSSQQHTNVKADEHADAQQE